MSVLLLVWSGDLVLWYQVNNSVVVLMVAAGRQPCLWLSVAKRGGRFVSATVIHGDRRVTCP